MPIAFDTIFTLRTLLRREAWHPLQTLSARCLGLGYGEYRLLGARAGSLAAYHAAVTGVPKSLKTFSRCIGGLDATDRTRLIKEAREALQAAGGGALPPPADRAFAAFAGDDPAFRSEMTRRCKAAAAAAGRAYQFAADLAVAQMTFGLLGLFHAAFNLACAQAGAQEPAQAARMTLAGSNRDLERELRARQRRLFSAIATLAPRDEWVEEAETLASRAERTLLEFAPLLARAGLAARTLLQHGRNPEATRLGRETLKGGELAREAMASFAAAYASAAAGANPFRKSGRRSVFKCPEGLAFDSPLPSPPLVSLPDLPDAADGEAVTVEGFVSGLQVIRARDGKLLSRVEVLDAASRTRACGAGIYTHFSHMGLTKGAFCRLSGTYRHRSRLFPDRPLIEVERMPLASLSMDSWRLRFLLAAQPWFRLYPNGIHMSWALGLQRCARQEGELTYNGAGELLFPPVVRN